MGAAPEEYAKVAPPGSFIHVDDYESPAALAAYLLKVDSDDVLYNSYFKWKVHVCPTLCSILCLILYPTLCTTLCPPLHSITIFNNTVNMT